jgi:4-hydroxy-2-oxoheptanedioate aldolase
MRKNRLKPILAGRECAIGTFVKSTDPANVEILALAGFDFFVLDNEHAAMDREQLTGIVRAAEAAGIEPIVRIKENTRAEIQQNLDLGYMGVQAPDVDTPKEAESLVRNAKYAPLGARGLSPSVRACDYGTCDAATYAQRANDNTLLIAHCETRSSVEHLDEILKVRGIDVIFIGPMDLSQSLGKTGATTDPSVLDVIAYITNKVKNSDKALGTVAASPEEAKALAEKGVQYILLGSDQGMLLRQGKEFTEKFRRDGFTKQ